MSDAGTTREERVTLEAAKSYSLLSQAGGAVVLEVPEAPGSPMLNRVVGLGIERAAVEEEVDAALAAVSAGVSFYVSVGPEARPAQLTAWLRARGLEQGWGWMLFRRDLESLPPVETSLGLIEVGTAEEAVAFARIVRVSFELPEAVEPRLASLPDAGWVCWLALDGDTPAGGGALYVDDAVAYLSFAGTLPEHRGKGAQTALLAARLRRGAELGCDVAVTETGEQRGDRVDNSYRNILRAGFTEDAVTANWRGQA